MLFLERQRITTIYKKNNLLCICYYMHYLASYFIIFYNYYSINNFFLLRHFIKFMNFTLYFKKFFIILLDNYKVRLNIYSNSSSISCYNYFTAPRLVNIEVYRNIQQCDYLFRNIYIYYYINIRYLLKYITPNYLQKNNILYALYYSLFYTYSSIISFSFFTPFSSKNTIIARNFIFQKNILPLSIPMQRVGYRDAVSESQLITKNIFSNSINSFNIIKNCARWLFFETFIDILKLIQNNFFFNNSYLHMRELRDFNFFFPNTGNITNLAIVEFCLIFFNKLFINNNIMGNNNILGKKNFINNNSVISIFNTDSIDSSNSEKLDCLSLLKFKLKQKKPKKQQKKNFKISNKSKHIVPTKHLRLIHLLDQCDLDEEDCNVENEEDLIDYDENDLVATILKTNMPAVDKNISFLKQNQILLNYKKLSYANNRYTRGYSMFFNQQFGGKLATSAYRRLYTIFNNLQFPINNQRTLHTTNSNLTALNSGFDSDYFVMPVFQMKPGYASLWRNYRQDFAKNSSLLYFRQRRWTNYFLSLSKISGMPLLLSHELSLYSILRASQFFFFTTDLYYISKKFLIYVNGCLSSSLYMQIYAGDCIQLVCLSSLIIYYNLTYFFFTNLKKNLFPKIINHLLSCNNYMQLELGITFYKKYFKQLNFGIYDIPNYLEVDYLTNNIFVLYIPFFFFEFNFFANNYSPVFAMRLYNWKYVI